MGGARQMCRVMLNSPSRAASSHSCADRDAGRGAACQRLAPGVAPGTVMPLGLVA